MVDQLKNMLIGVFVIVAIAIMVFILLFLHPTVGDSGKVLHVRFTNIDKVSEGTRVTFAGKPIGEVVEIREVEEARTEQRYRKGDVYIYELVLRIDSGVDVYNTDEITIRTSGLLGERSIEIVPKPARKGQHLRLVTEDEIIFATSPGSVEDAMATLGEVAGKMGKAFDAATEQIKEMKERQLVENVSVTAQNLRDITTALNQPEEWSNMIKTMNSTLERFSVASENLGKMAEGGTVIVERVNKGEGTIGQLIAKDDLYLRLTSAMNKAETLMNDINHYGLLFHLDKGWQRLRARRVNLMQKLSTPQEFRNFFQDEIDQVSTALGRVSMVLRAADEQCDLKEFICSYEFAKTFAELLRRIEALEDNIKLYDQQVVEMREKCHPKQKCIQ